MMEYVIPAVATIIIAIIEAVAAKDRNAAVQAALDADKAE